MRFKELFENKEYKEKILSYLHSPNENSPIIKEFLIWFNKLNNRAKILTKFKSYKTVKDSHGYARLIFQKFVKQKYDIEYNKFFYNEQDYKKLGIRISSILNDLK